jgi:hypothetical protein
MFSQVDSINHSYGTEDIMHFRFSCSAASCGTPTSSNTSPSDDGVKINLAVNRIMKDMPVPGMLLSVFVEGKPDLVLKWDK